MTVLMSSHKYPHRLGPWLSNLNSMHADLPLDVPVANHPITLKKTDLLTRLLYKIDTKSMDEKQSRSGREYPLVFRYSFRQFQPVR